MKQGFDRETLFASLITDTVRATATRTVERVAHHERNLPEDGAARVVLPPPAPATLSLETSLRLRTSVRTYDHRAVTLAQVSAMLASADAQDALNWSREREAGVAVELLVAAWRVSSLDVGLYRFDGTANALIRCADLPTGPAVEGLLLQREFASAPLMILVMGDLRAAVRRHNSHGHRLILNRAGAAAHAAWLAALGVDLAGAVFAGLLPGAVRELLGVDGYRSAPLLALSVGWPVNPDADSRSEEHRKEVNHGEAQR